MNEWRPIETAPKDERFVDLWVEVSGVYIRITDCWWCPERSTWLVGPGNWDGPEDIVSQGGTPTHWMPLPPQPPPGPLV